MKQFLSQSILTESRRLIDGILISHPHQDHYGFVNYLHENLKYYLGEAAFRIINTANDSRFLTQVENFWSKIYKKHLFLGDISLF